MTRVVVHYVDGAIQETAAVSVAPQTVDIMSEMLEKLNMWHRRWAQPLRIFGE